MTIHTKNKRRSWLQLMVGLAVIYLFIFWVVPFFNHLPLYQKAIQHIEEQDIDPRALFYTESKEAVAAGREMKKRVQQPDPSPPVSQTDE